MESRTFRHADERGWTLVTPHFVNHEIISFMFE